MSFVFILKEILSLKIEKSLAAVLVGLLALNFYMKYDFQNKLNDFKNDIIFSIDKRLVKIETLIEYERSLQNKKVRVIK